MKKLLLIVITHALISNIKGQELYVFTEPASNMPAKSLAIRLTGRYQVAPFKHRYMPELMAGISKKWMFHFSGTFSDYYTRSLHPESIRTYAKFRFLSNDDVHRHIRIAVFGDISYSRSPFIYDETSLEGDNSGVQGGLIVTQLIDRFAMSATTSYSKLFAVSSSKTLNPNPSYQFLNYSLSTGMLLLPKTYTDYKQLNLNVYMEILGTKSMENNQYNIDMAPAFQLILTSTSKINLGYRFQVLGNMNRMATNTWQIGF